MVVKKSRDARFQLHIWSRLLEGRMALQKVLDASRDLDKSLGELDNRTSVDDSTIKSITKLQSTLVRLRDTYRLKGQFKLDKDSQDNLAEENYADINDDFLDDRHERYTSIRSEIIEKWYEKTKIGQIPKKGYTALELPTHQLIANALRDKGRLIRRTQLDRTSPLDNDTHPETFNDDDFYHQLLKEVISKDEGRKWVELQRFRYKAKRRADTKATKGRKIKKDLIPKLVNFMAPMRPANKRGTERLPEKIRDELLRSLFGGSVS